MLALGSDGVPWASIRAWRFVPGVYSDQMRGGCVGMLGLPEPDMRTTILCPSDAIFVDERPWECLIPRVLRSLTRRATASVPRYRRIFTVPPASIPSHTRSYAFVFLYAFWKILRRDRPSFPLSLSSQWPRLLMSSNAGDVTPSTFDARSYHPQRNAPDRHRHVWLTSSIGRRLVDSCG